MEFETWDRDTLIKAILVEREIANSPQTHSEAELRRLPPGILQKIYLDLKEHDEKFWKECARSIEEKRFFNQPECNANFIYWAKQSHWVSNDEAVALLLGKDPRKVTWESVKEHISDSPFAKEFEELLGLVERYVEDGTLKYHSSPSTFLAWAEKLKIKVPIELKEALFSLEKWVNWEDKYAQLTAEQEQLVANDKNSEKNTPNRVDSAKLHTKTSQSLFKLIAAMAYAKYDYDPDVDKGPVPMRLSKDVMRYLGTTISLNTIRTWLKNACDEHPNLTKRTK